LQGARTARGSRSPSTARGTRSLGTRGRPPFLFLCVLLVAIGQGSTLGIRSDLRSPRHAGQATSQWAGPSAGAPITRASPDGARAILARPQTASPIRRDGTRSEILFFFLSCDRWLEPWQIRRSQRGRSLDRIWTNSRGTGSIRSLATNDVTIRSETFDEEQFCRIRSTTLCSNLSNLTTNWWESVIPLRSESSR
jgi:hypothetical protein